MTVLTKHSLIRLFIVLIAITLGADCQNTRAQHPNDFLVRAWTLTNMAYPNDGRVIVFHDTSLAGTYYTTNGEGRRITDAIYKDGNLYFRIPDLQLYFELRWVGDHFDGRMILYGTNERRAPEPVRMTRR